MLSSPSSTRPSVRAIVDRKLAQPLYRADIDGLRALAILTVFINHADKAWLPSGFVGVDIFFVISGFVVTWSLIGHDGDRSGILGFWRRRILRILPALLVAVVGGLILLSLFFAVAIEQHFAAAARTGMAAIFGVSNIYLLRTSSDYFLLDLSINIFNHTWSLGVEEQFYVLFALLFFSVRRFGHIRWKQLFLCVVTALSIASLAFFISDGVKGNLTIYYGLHARFWELGVGALIAVAVSMKAARDLQSNRRWLAEVLAATGTAMMIGAAFLPHGLRTEFVLPVLIAVAGAALFIGAGSFSRTVAGRLFSSPGLIVIGLLSYSLYLWHWPVLTIFRISVGLSLLAIVAAAAVTWILAWLSFTFVETPAQRYRGSLFGRILPFAAATVAATVILGVTVTRTQGQAYASAHFDRDEWLPPISRPYAPSGALAGSKCRLDAGATIPARIPEACRLKPNSPEPSLPGVILVGDSHAFATFAMIGGLESKGFHGAALVHDGCGIFAPRNQVSSSCREYWDALPRFIADAAQPGDVVLFSGLLPTDRPVDENLITSRLIMLGRAAETAGARLAIELPHIKSAKPAVYCREEWFRYDYSGCEVTKSALETRRKKMLATLDSAGAALDTPPLYWDPLQHLCRDGICRATDGPHPVLRDKNHISARAAALLSEPFAEFLRTQGSPVPVRPGAPTRTRETH